MKLETKNYLMVPSLRVGGLVEVDWSKITRRLQKSQRKIDRARRRASRIERILFKSFTATAWLWVKQEGKCPCCGKPITWRMGWSKHHIVPKSQGGTDSLKNLQLLHPACHRQLHLECDKALISPIDHIREALNLLAALDSRLQRLGPLPPDVLESWDRVSTWLDCQEVLEGWDRLSTSLECHIRERRVAA